jgi:hypothetical protein
VRDLSAESRQRLREIDLRWHDLRHEGACRLLADGVDVRVIQLMLGHSTLQQTQRYLNVTDEEMRKGMQISWTSVGSDWRRRADTGVAPEGLSADCQLKRKMGYSESP